MQDFYLAYARGAAAMMQAYSPLLKGATRANLEVMNFASRRTRAYAEMPARMARCRSPLDVMAAQADFWREACEHHAESSRKILESFFASSPAAARAAPQPKQERHKQDKARDYIAFPDPKAARAPGQTNRGPRNKAAANRSRLS